jgi:hypothetical protein
MPRPPSSARPTLRLAASFREDYDLLDPDDRASVDRLVGRLGERIETGRELGRGVVALDEYRLMRSLAVSDDAILTVTDGRVSLDVLCRTGSAEVIVLGAAGRDVAACRLAIDPTPALAG